LHENSQPPGDFGELIDYAVKMVRFDNSKLMTQCLESGQVTEKCIDEIADILSDFYETVAITSPEISSFGNIEQIKKINQENLLSMRQIVENNNQPPLLSQQTVEEIQFATDTFFSHYAWLFEKRVREGRIKECHGDLHSGNICLSEPIEIFDCIEFNEEFKDVDIAFDIAFLCMDLDFYNERFLAERLVLNITEQTRDWDLVKLINFYKVTFLTFCSRS
jgi:aminoglycoside phosphotransferase family enzyme